MADLAPPSRRRPPLPRLPRPGQPPPPPPPGKHTRGGVSGLGAEAAGMAETGLVGSLLEEDGHVYSLAVAGDLLYTGTDSRDMQVWKDQREFAGFRSGSGLIKAIVVAGDRRIYTGHQDGKVRVGRRPHRAQAGRLAPETRGCVEELSQAVALRRDAAPAQRDLNIQSPPSIYPPKRYCDITGFEAPYVDPRTKLRYADPEVFQANQNAS